MTREEALAIVEGRGVVLESAHGSAPSMVELIAGEKVRGSWWGHKKGKEIYGITRFLRDSPDVLVCRLIEGKVTYVHKRLWPALIRLADDLDAFRTNALQEVHTASGKHETKEFPLLAFVPQESRNAAKRMSRTEALAALRVSSDFALGASSGSPNKARRSDRRAATRRAAKTRSSRSAR